jgi:perosamine synthetase
MEKYRQIVEFIRSIYKPTEGLIPLHAPVFKGNEKKYLDECVDTTFVSSVGKFVTQFEDEIARYTGSKKAVACVNGTSALHLALKLAGVNQGDEVITQPLTFIATVNAITYCGARPVFLDVDIDTMGLSPSKLEVWLKGNVIMKKPVRGMRHAACGTRNLEPKTLNLEPFNKSSGKRISACVPMHTFGHPCRIDEIVEICEKYNIPVVEDATESLGSYYKGKHTGTFGTIGVLSFNGNKIITTGGGGMLLFDDEERARHAKHLTTQAKIPHPWEFVHDEIGYNYRMPNINAALGVAQLEKLPVFLESKRLLAKKYKEFFTRLDSDDLSRGSIKFFNEPKDAISNYWLNCILLNNITERDAFLNYSNEKGIMTRPVWQLMNRLEMFRDCQTGSLGNSNNLADKLVNIPSSAIIN